jgi:peptide deformylase
LEALRHGRIGYIREILLLGNPFLRKRCRRVATPADPAVTTIVKDLRDTLQEFRRLRGFGRGIAAPQLGSPERVIYIDYEFSGGMINPRIVRRSRKKFLLWDDCFSYPELVAKVERAKEVDVEFLDEAGQRASRHRAALRSPSIMKLIT